APHTSVALEYRPDGRPVQGHLWPSNHCSDTNSERSHLPGGGTAPMRKEATGSAERTKARRRESLGIDADLHGPVADCPTEVDGARRPGRGPVWIDGAVHFRADFVAVAADRRPAVEPQLLPIGSG